MERPILFNSEMVRAILDNRKTQTRRVIKPQPTNADYWTLLHTVGLRDSFYPNTIKATPGRLACPHGQPGDRLWVRETWRIESFIDGEPIEFGYKDGATMEERCEGQDAPNYEDWMERMNVQSTEDCERSGLMCDEEGYYSWEHGNSPCRWRPSIHMPRWASRLTLEVTGVRVEQVQSISHEDALAEGVVAFTVSPGTAPASYPITFYSPGPHDEGGYPQAREAFENLWDSINAKRGYGWDVNPWVWVVEFGRA